MSKLKEFMTSKSLEQFLDWGFTVCCGIISLGFITLTVTNIYIAISQAIIFAISGVLFCPKVKTPLAVKVLLGILLVFAT